MFIQIKQEIKQLLRDPIMGILFLCPFIIPLVFSAILILGNPLLKKHIEIDLWKYTTYIQSLAFLLPPGIMGIIVGFRLLDDKDQHIAELMQVTPWGLKKYVLFRLFFVFFLTIFYCIYSYVVLPLISINPVTLLLVSLLCGIFGISLGLILFLFAPDKVKGLTYAKGLNLIMIFVFSDIIPIPFINSIALFFPTYWISILLKSFLWKNIIFATGVHLIWLFFFFFLIRKRKMLL